MGRETTVRALRCAPSGYGYGLEELYVGMWTSVTPILLVIVRIFPATVRQFLTNICVFKIK